MLGTKEYHGTPFQKHRDLSPFDLSLFDHWFFLFAETTHEAHTPEIAELFIEKSQQIAKSLKFGLYGELGPRT